MSIPKFKRKSRGLDYVDNVYNLQVEIMNLCSKLSAVGKNLSATNRQACLITG